MKHEAAELFVLLVDITLFADCGELYMAIKLHPIVVIRVIVDDELVHNVSNYDICLSIGMEGRAFMDVQAILP